MHHLACGDSYFGVKLLIVISGERNEVNVTHSAFVFLFNLCLLLTLSQFMNLRSYCYLDTRGISALIGSRFTFCVFYGVETEELRILGIKRRECHL